MDTFPPQPMGLNYRYICGLNNKKSFGMVSNLHICMIKATAMLARKILEEHWITCPKLML